MVPITGNNLLARLTETDGRLLSFIAERASQLGMALYTVGGLPRDLVLGRPVWDLDLVVEGDAIHLARALAAECGGKVTGHSRFGTAKWDITDAQLPQVATDTARAMGGPGRRQHVDLISARTEDYEHPGALPRVRSGTILQDLARRDFTINTLAIRLDGQHRGEVLDVYGALRDIQLRRVRVLHASSFQDDPTRMYRAVRYETRLGFSITPETRRLIPAALVHVAGISAHRLRRELELILVEEGAASMLQRLGSIGLLRAIHPALRHDRVTLRRFHAAGSSSAASLSARPTSLERSRWILWLMSLPAPTARSVLRRLQLNNTLADEVLAAGRLWRRRHTMRGLRPSQITQRLERLPLAAVTAVALATETGATREAFQNYLTKWRHVRPRTTSADLGALGIAPGPAYGAILRRLRTGWLDGEFESPRDERRALLQAAGKFGNARRTTTPPRRRTRTAGTRSLH